MNPPTISPPPGSKPSPVAPNVPAALVTDGRICAVLFFDAGNPSDAVVLAFYG